MAVWTSDEPEFLLVQNLSVPLFYHWQILRETLADLEKRQYHIVELNCDVPIETFHTDVSTALDFPDYYGRNMDALNDCLYDVGSGYYGPPKNATGLVVVLEHVDRCSYADSLLNIFCYQSFYAALLGNRMLCLAEVDDDPDFHLTLGQIDLPLGMWNTRQFYDSRRHDNR